MRRTAYAAIGLTAAAYALAGAAPAPVVNGPTTGPLVHTGDVDLLEDVLEHVSAPSGGQSAHQIYQESGAEA